MTTLNIPSKPTNWVASTDIVLREGCKPTCRCVRPWNAVTPWVVHTACVNENGEWEYYYGSYFRDLGDAMNHFHNG